jgi:hypothetical protein
MAAAFSTKSIISLNSGGCALFGRENVVNKSRQIPFLSSTVAETGRAPADAQPIGTRLELAMHAFPALAASALLVMATGAAAAANSTRIAETGAALLGNAHRCGVADERLVRAGKVVRELIVASSDNPDEQKAAKSRFAETFRASAQSEAEGHRPIPPCKTVLAQFERLEQFRKTLDVR